MITRPSSPRFAACAALAATVVLGAAACGGPATSGGSADGTRVIASFYPMAWLAEQVGGDAVSVGTLTRSGVEPHDVELTPPQLGEVTQADLVIYIKGLQPAVDQAVEQHAGDRAFDVADAVPTLPLPDPDGADDPARDPADDHAHEGEPGEHDAHGDADHDPHLWLDPQRMKTAATDLGERLAEADPGNAAEHRAGAVRAAGRLDRLDEQIRDGLASCTQNTLVTSHAAFGYFADRYGLRQVSIAGIDPGNEPSPGRLGELTRLVRDAGVETVFTETLVSPKVAETLADAAGVRTAVLDPVEGVRQGSGDDYVSIMERNLGTLRSSLECS